MNSLALFVLPLAWTLKMVKCSGEEDENTSTSQNTFNFDLSHQKSSNKYTLSHRLNDPFVVSVLKPLEGFKLNKLVDGYEKVAEFEPSETVIELVYLPRKSPKLLSLKYLSNGHEKVKRLRKLLTWYEVSDDTFKYFYNELTTGSVETEFDVFELKEGKPGVEAENYGDHKCFNVTFPAPYTTSKVAYGQYVMWEAKGEERVTSAFVSKETLPKLVSLCLTDGQSTDFKYFTSFGEKFEDVSQQEFRFVLESYTELQGRDFVLDLKSPDVTRVEMGFAPVDGLAFVNVHPKESSNVTMLKVGSYVLWKQTESKKLVNVSYTLEKNPRLYNILLSSEGEEGVKDYSVYFMKLVDTFYSLPEEEYVSKVGSLKKKRTQLERPNSYDLSGLMKRTEKFEFASVMYEPLFSTVSEVHCNNTLLWTSNDGLKLLKLHLYKMGDTYLTQHRLIDSKNNVSTRYFQDSKSYFKNEEKYSNSSLWLWISSATFFKTVEHHLLMETYHSIDLTAKVDLGAFESRTGSVGGVLVKTMVPYPSHTCTSLFYGNKILWSSPVDVFLGVSTYGKLSTQDGRQGNKDQYQLAELFLRRDQKVVRLYYMKSGELWNAVEQSQFEENYQKLRN